jgi:hypothetical protein
LNGSATFLAKRLKKLKKKPGELLEAWITFGETVSSVVLANQGARLGRKPWQR